MMCMELIRNTPPAPTSADQAAFAECSNDIHTPQQQENNDTLLAKLQQATKEREAAELAMRVSEMRYRRLFEASKDSIIIIDGDSLAILDTNQAAERLLDMSKARARGRILPSLHPFATVPSIDQRFHELANQAVTHQEIILKANEDNTIQHLDIVASVYAEQDQSVVQLSIRDITDRKKTMRLEAETADLIAQRQELLNINAAKDEFISVASHQLRTPATAVKQYVSILLQGYVGRLTRDQRHVLDRAFTSNERQLKIINDLLLVARVDAGKITLNREPADVTRLIRDVVSEQQPILDRRRQQLILNLPRTLKATLDSRFMRMVLENLLNNATKYSPEDTAITITARRDRRCCYIDISDRGFGISTADQSKLYRKFSRIYNERAVSVEGTGLGLYWSKKIIELHDGSLDLQSQLNIGSTFTIRLPIK